MMRYPWTARLFNSLGCELAMARSRTMKELNQAIRGWTLSNGDTIKIEGPDE